jgi:hypothetical protein
MVPCSVSSSQCSKGARAVRNGAKVRKLMVASLAPSSCLHYSKETQVVPKEAEVRKLNYMFCVAMKRLPSTKIE